ncbi:MAG TPA: glycosyltransferase family 2 protein [Bosea sp. (in: a-proteobacteria)]|uniref:glycosyltransferase family 2 protein n=1 Tax=Bosea sp. (in: a-proteobacteria) TaxID=1871050 RepID=UPI002E0D27E4|nr:glycosyltransferase family 2 protein [Bosea sp. (in: a-proteobacteria)]
MPAHDEEAIIARSIASIMAQLPASGRLLVVADNCSDDTAQVAAAAGADLAIRHDLTRVGKGYALDHGVRFLGIDPPEVVIIIDADCEAMPGTLDHLARQCAATGRPAQARDTVLAPSSPSPADKVSLLAWTVKTLVRPLGSTRLGWPCQLMGTGMALPFDLIRRLDLATGHLAEDQKIGAELALAGKPPLFCPQAQVVSRLPEGETGKNQQRTRWEHGHLAIIGEFLFPMLRQSIAKRSLQLFAFTLDLCIPPLTLLAMSLLLMAGLSLLWFAATGAAAPFIVSLIVLACLAATIAMAWWQFGRAIISWRELAAAPAYCLLKIPSFIRFFFHRQVDWVRTER